MKIRQLINILQEEDPNAEIKLAIDEDCNATYPVLNVILQENDTVIVLIPNEFEEE